MEQDKKPGGMLSFFDKVKSKKLMRLNWKFIGVIATSIGKFPFIRRNIPWSKPEYSNMYWIPVNRSLDQLGDSIVPQEIIAHFIEKSSHRVIVNFCGCRFANQCENYPIDIGCLMMGEDSRGIVSKVARSVTKEEAHEHLKKAVAAGLAPFVGKARVDNAIFGVPDTGRLVSVCFCDECCCLTRWSKSIPGDERKQFMHRLDGLTIHVDTDLCTGCGTCADKCFLKLIKLDSGTAKIPEDQCMGCGRCVIVCPQNAIKVKLDNDDFINQAVKNIESYVKPD
ncbi:MAG: 4Fe-4S binding protein [Spirochaetes bacterium]|jgi:UDP-glucose 4-epimerase|nr:4Fe-4S binding protein [Spirochaetota bacterium]